MKCDQCGKKIEQGIHDAEYLAVLVFEERDNAQPDGNPPQAFEGWRLCSRSCVAAFVKETLP